MITVNNRPLEHFDGMTIEDILEMKNYTYEGLIIRVNGALVEDRDYQVQDGDDVKVIHICQGG